MSDASLLVITGEVSGDMHAGAAIEVLRGLRPGMEIFGIGGDALEAAGMELIYHVREMAVFGPFAALVRYPHFRRVFRHLLRIVDERGPGAVLLVDYGGFNLRFAREVKRRGIPVLYYISPQVWASRPQRIHTMAEVADRLLAIFPFEPTVYAETGLEVEYVGHPLVDATALARAEPLAALPWPGEPRVALLPGSRAQEIDRLLPLLMESARTIERTVPHAGFLVAAPTREVERQIRQKLASGILLPARLELVTGQTRQVLRQARAAVVASGTATLEAALMRCPMVVVYKTSALMFALARRIVKVPYIGMVNLIAGRELCPERIQGDARGDAVAAALMPLLGETQERSDMLHGFDGVIQTLGQGGAARRVAGIINETFSL